jgi:invasion protein IalB
MGFRSVALFALVAAAAALAIALAMWAFSTARRESNSAPAQAGSSALAQAREPPEAGSDAPAGKVSDRQSFGDWAYGCITPTGGAQTQCMIANQFLDAKTKAVIFRWTIARNGDKLVSVWHTPTGILVNRGLVLDAGTAKPIAVPFKSCSRGSCQAVANLAPEFVETLSKTDKATATIYGTNGKGIAFNVSVKGLADALAALGR